jgi:beta-lactamase class A
MGPTVLSRRTLLRVLPGFVFPSSLAAGSELEVLLQERFAAIEMGIGGRLGVAALNTENGLRTGYRAGELFPMCSTFKLLLAACILRRVDAMTEDLHRPIPYTKGDLQEYAPVTGAHVPEGAMTVGELCAAAVEVSDNTAANLLLAEVGGPIGLTEFIRSLRDEVTRLDRTEPELNSALPGDPRDTTSPEAMLDSMTKLLTGDALSAASRARLTAWLEASTTGKDRLRAGFPSGWRAGDKTGTGERGTMGDLGIFWPPERKPILVAAYVTECSASREKQEQAIAAVGRVVLEKL